MPGIAGNAIPLKNTSYKLVLPFYSYAALSLLLATVLLFIFAEAFTGHYFHPYTLAITHTMALGWGTMMILGASHQLIPVLIESKLHSEFLGYLSFVLAAFGIPLLVFGFYSFDMGLPAQLGGWLINASIFSFVINLILSISKTKQENIHAIFVFTASLWLLVTTILGLLLVYNFTGTVLPSGSVEYLSVHAHLGIVGWFLLLVLGVGSRLIPMFLVSKYTNNYLLWWVYGLVNSSMLLYILLFRYYPVPLFYLVPVLLVMAGLLLFTRYCYHCYRERIRRKVDPQVRTSLLAVIFMLLPVLLLLCMILVLAVTGNHTRIVLVYGFTIFFGWITAIIFGMTLKTLPFIVWNKVYHQLAGTVKTPNPKDLFNNNIFRFMMLTYLLGFVLFIFGIFSVNIFLIRSASIFLIAAALLYNTNVFKIITHKRIP